MLYCEPPPHPLSTTPTLRTGEEPTFPSPASCRWFALPSHPNCQPQKQELSAPPWVRCQNSAHLPATWGLSQGFPVRGKENKRHSCLQNVSDFVLKVTKRTSAPKCRLGNCGGHSQESPKGHFTSQGVTAVSLFSSQSQLTALLLEPVVAAFPGSQWQLCDRKSCMALTLWPELGP